MRNSIPLSGLLLIGSIAAASGQDEAKPPESLKEKASYILGRDIARDLNDRLIEFDLEQLVAGIRDSVSGKPSVLSAEDTDSVMKTFSRELEKRQDEKVREVADKNMRETQTFLKEHALKEGVKQLESGLQYSLLVEGDGEVPKIGDRVKVHFVGQTMAGKVFESTRTNNEPATVAIGGIGVRGVVEALLRMKVGSKWLVVVPPELAYGVAGLPPEIGPNETLVFEIELLEIVR